MEWYELETPALVVDLDRMERNLDRVAAYARQHGLALRPHVKTHKAAHIAREQVRRGAVGLTCATLREAEVVSQVTNDVLVAYPIVGALKLQRLFTLPAQVRITVALDSSEALEALGKAAASHKRQVGVYIEVDMGARRVGVATPDAVVELAQAARTHPYLDYAGITFYPGHIRAPIVDQDDDIHLVQQGVTAFVAALTSAGFAPPAVSGGSTPTLWRSHEIAELTEIRPGTSVFNDRTTADIGACAIDDCALTVAATVVSTAVSGQAVVDAGAKALGREPLRGTPGGGTPGDGFGIVLEHPDVTVSTLTEEHGVLDLSRTSWSPRVGDVIRIIPNHVCIVVHLHDRVFGGRDDTIEEHWMVEARGRQTWA